MLRWLAPIVAILLVPVAALGSDYDRNVVAERALALGAGIAPVDVDPAPPTPCADDKNRNCVANISQPGVVFLRGSARRHIRRFYVGVEVELGATTPRATFGVHPWLAGGASIGLETADNGWDRLRGYGELAVLAIWANTRIGETLTFAAETGVKWQLASTSRPHLLLHLGVRGLYNFSHLGAVAVLGAAWTFD